jgi:hypothetical protein
MDIDVTNMYVIEGIKQAPSTWLQTWLLNQNPIMFKYYFDQR